MLLRAPTVKGRAGGRPLPFRFPEEAEVEKLIYLLGRPGSASIEDLRETLLGDGADALRRAGATRVVVNVADVADQVARSAPARLIGPWEDVSGAVALWLDSVDERGAVEDALDGICSSIAGYLVTESVPQPFEVDWEPGERRPGVTQFGANGKPAGVSDAEFFRNWAAHTRASFDLHPRRWSYVRNAVARPLTEGAPPYRAIVSEHFRDLDVFTDDSSYFGSEEAVREMLDALPGFCDLGLLFSVPTSEYQLT